MPPTLKKKKKNFLQHNVKLKILQICYFCCMCYIVNLTLSKYCQLYTVLSQYNLTLQSTSSKSHASLNNWDQSLPQTDRQTDRQILWHHIQGYADFFFQLNKVFKISYEVLPIPPPLKLTPKMHQRSVWVNSHLKQQTFWKKTRICSKGIETGWQPDLFNLKQYISQSPSHNQFLHSPWKRS